MYHCTVPQAHPGTVGTIALAPHASVLNFAQACFEGFKAYRTPAGRVALFRPDMNMKRMQTSARRATLPVRPHFLSAQAWGTDSEACRNLTVLRWWNSSGSSSAWRRTGCRISLGIACMYGRSFVRPQSSRLVRATLMDMQ